MTFPPSWFTVVMGTSITSSLLYAFPYQARWLHYLSYIVLALAVFFFVLFLTISLVRYIRWPTLIRLMLQHPQQSMFLGAFAVGFDAVVNLCATIICPHWGYNFTLFVWALWMLASVVSGLSVLACPSSNSRAMNIRSRRSPV